LLARSLSLSFSKLLYPKFTFVASTKVQILTLTRLATTCGFSLLSLLVQKYKYSLQLWRQATRGFLGFVEKTMSVTEKQDMTDSEQVSSACTHTHKHTRAHTHTNTHTHTHTHV
jgi:hypothetical protein